MQGRAILFGLFLSLSGLPTHAAGPAPADEKAGKEANTRGMRLYKAKDYAKAAVEFRAAITASPKLTVAHYNLACIAALTNDKKTLLAELEWLKADGEMGADKLRRARSDQDFAAFMGDAQVRKILDTVAFVPELPALLAVKELTTVSKPAANAKNSDPLVMFDPKIVGDPGGSQHFGSLWCEDKPDAGIGEGFAIAFYEPTKLDKLRIGAGDWASSKAFNKRNRVLEVEVTIDGTRKVKGALPKVDKDALDGDFSEESDGLPWIDIALGGSAVKSIAVTLTKVKPGKLNDSCVTALHFMRGETKLLPLLEVPPAALTSLPAAITTVQDAIIGSEPALMQKVFEFPFTHEYTDDERMCAFKGKCPSTVIKDAAAAAKAGLPELPGNANPLYLHPDGPGVVRINVPTGVEVIKTWHMTWKNGAWKLSGVGWET